jgi:hypothetical protein
MYALNNHINWVDPSRMSPSYAYRLSKYKQRGFNIGIPFLTEENIDRDAVRVIVHDLLSYYISNIPVRVPKNTLFTDSIQEFTGHLQQQHLDAINADMNKHQPNGHKHPIGALVHAISPYRVSMPRDPVSILILAQVYGVFTAWWKRSDYDLKGRELSIYLLYRHRYYRTIDDASGQALDMVNEIMNSDHTQESIETLQVEMQAVSNIIWKEQNPMEQLTGTFLPTPISRSREGMLEWYKSSPLYKQ